VTTDLRKGCTEGHTGTSASAPLAAGICALALQANPNLSWRDLQHIVVQTARPEKLNADDWVINGVGRKVSHHFGYGLMDASAMVDVALNWTNVPPQRKCEITYYGGPHKISQRGRARMYLESDGCRNDPLHTVLYVEHVAAHITLSASRRGEIQIYLTSPAGTKSTLLQRRGRDHSMDGFNNWAFMTTHNWGELSLGQWTLEVENRETSSELKSWSLVIYGTATNPQYGPRHRPRPQDPGTPPVFNHARSTGHHSPNSGVYLLAMFLLALARCSLLPALLTS
jgi:furin